MNSTDHEPPPDEPTADARPSTSSDTTEAATATSRSHESQTRTPALSDPPPRRRRWLRRLTYAMLGLIALLAAAPYLFNFAPVRTAVLSIASIGMNGHVRIEESSLGWFSPLSMRDVIVEPDAGPPLIQVHAVQGDVPLWRYAVGSSELGTLELIEPLIRVELHEGGSNFKDVFAPLPHDVDDPNDLARAQLEAERQLAQIARFHVRVEVQHGKLLYTGRESTREWTVADFSATFGIRPVEIHSTLRPEFWIDQGIVLERISVTPEMCNDALKYVAPVLAGTAEVDGQFSLEIDECQVPLGLPEEGALQGRFVIDHVVVGSAGPVVKRISAALNIAPTTELARDSVVNFYMKDGRVYHEGLRFHLPGVNIQTSGSVGVDHSLDLLAEIQLPLNEIHDGPLLRALSKQRLVIPIRGTLEFPEIDGAALGGSTTQMVLGTVQEVLNNDSLTLGSLLENLAQRRALDPNAPAPDPNTPASNGSDPNDADSLDIQIGDGQLLERFLQRRAAGERPLLGGRAWRLRQPDANAADSDSPSRDPLKPSPEADSGDASEVPRARGFFRRRRNRRTETDATPQVQ